MTIHNNFCRICGAQFQTEGEPEKICPVCESIRKESATEHFVEACDVRRVKRENGG